MKSRRPAGGSFMEAATALARAVSSSRQPARVAGRCTMDAFCVSVQNKHEKTWGAAHASVFWENNRAGPTSAPRFTPPIRGAPADTT